MLSGVAITPNGSITYKLPEIFRLSNLVVRINQEVVVHANADGGTGGGKLVTGKAGWEFAADWSPEMVPGLRVGGVMGTMRRLQIRWKVMIRDREETYFATYAYGPLYQLVIK